MAEGDLATGIVIGLLIGIPTGLAAMWIFTQIPQIGSPKTYSNLEEWEVLKDPETGRVRGVRAHRSAKEG